MPATGRPSFGTLADWIEGRLSADAASRVEEAVAGDPAAQRSVDWLRWFVRAADSLPLHCPPPVVRQRLEQHFLTRRSGRPGGGGTVAEWEAALEYDSRHGRQLTGVRGGPGHGEALHLAYASEVADVVLDVTRAGAGAADIDGQVMLAEGEADFPVFTAAASGPGIERRTIDGDRIGRFRLVEVPAGVGRLRVENGVVAITLPLDIASAW